VFKLLAHRKDDRLVRRSPVLTASLAILAATATVVTLSGCSGISMPDLSGACAPAYQPGDASDLVTASGDIGEFPNVNFPTPIIAPTPERTVLIEGEGSPLPVGGTAQLSYTAFDGESGSLLYHTEMLEIAGDLRVSFSRAIECARQGSRLILVTSKADSSLQVLQDFEPNPYYVVVIDVVTTWLGKANGVNQLPLDGMPTVVTAVDGQPGIVVPAKPAPSEHRIATIKSGGGAVLAESDSAVLHLRSWGWPSTPGRRPFQNLDTWLTPPLIIPVADYNDFGPGFADALRGAKVGSQLLIVLTADEEGGAATIYVVDVLGIAEPANAGSE
jgi:hypothetical protein